MLCKAIFLLQVYKKGNRERERERERGEVKYLETRKTLLSGGRWKARQEQHLHIKSNNYPRPMVEALVCKKGGQKKSKTQK